jgi:hypothetical protein
MSVSNARVARHGVQKAEENWTSVTRDPNSVPMSAAEIADATDRDLADFTFPRLRWYQIRCCERKNYENWKVIIHAGILSLLWHAFYF